MDEDWFQANAPQTQADGQNWFTQNAPQTQAPPVLQQTGSTVVAEPSILQKTGRAVVDTLKGFLPQSLSDVALAPFNMIPGFGQAVKPLENIAFGRPISEGVNPLSGIPVVQRIPEIIAAEKTPALSQERFTTGAGVVADLAMVAGLKSVLHPELAEVTGIPKPEVAAVPTEPVATDAATAETQTATQPGQFTTTVPASSDQAARNLSGQFADLNTQASDIQSKIDAQRMAASSAPIPAEQVAVNRELAPLTESPSAIAEPFPSISQSAEDARRTELQQKPPGVREAISLDEIRLIRERDELNAQNDISKAATGVTHPAVDERLGQIDQELTNIANKELQPTGQEPVPIQKQGGINATEERQIAESNIDVPEPKVADVKRELSKIKGESVKAVNSVGDTVTFTEPSVAYREGKPITVKNNKAGRITLIRSDGKIEIKAQDGGYRVLTPDEFKNVSQKPSPVPELPVPTTAKTSQEIPVEPPTPPVTEAATGVHAAALKERPINAPPPGEVVGWEANRESGHQWLDSGGDPSEIIQKFADTKAVTPEDMGRMSAALQRLQAGTDAAGDALRKDPGNPELDTAYRTALDAEQRFTDAFKPMHTFASANLASLQGKIPFDEGAAKSFTGMHREFQANHDGRGFTPEEEVKADSLVKKNTEAGQKYQAVNNELFKTVDKELEKVPSKIRGRAPTLKELGEMFSEKLKEVCDV